MAQSGVPSAGASVAGSGFTAFACRSLPGRRVAAIYSIAAVAPRAPLDSPRAARLASDPIPSRGSRRMPLRWKPHLIVLLCLSAAAFLGARPPKASAAIDLPDEFVNEVLVTGLE